MIHEVLVLQTAGTRAVVVILIVLGIILAMLVLFIWYLSRISKNREKLKLQLDKLTEELEEARRQKEAEKRDSSVDSG